MSEATYTNRRIEKLTVGRLEDSAIISTDGIGSGAPKEVVAILNPGDEYELELRDFNTISGYRINGVWVSRKTDQELQKAHDDMVAESRRKHREFIDAHQEEYDKIEESLPGWAKKILEINQKAAENQGEDFNYMFMGRSYTLIALRLAVLYAEAGDIVKNSMGPLKSEDIPENIRDYCNTYGVSGNQEDWAQYIARGYLNGDIKES